MMIDVRKFGLAGVISLSVAAAAIPLASANDIVDEWSSQKMPAAPALKPVTIDSKSTALLMLDFMNQNCGKRPRCLASIPAVKKLLGEARAHKVAVVYSIIASEWPTVKAHLTYQLNDKPRD